MWQTIVMDQYHSIVRPMAMYHRKPLKNHQIQLQKPLTIPGCWKCAIWEIELNGQYQCCQILLTLKLIASNLTVQCVVITVHSECLHNFYVWNCGYYLTNYWICMITSKSRTFYQKAKKSSHILVYFWPLFQNTIYLSFLILWKITAQMIFIKWYFWDKVKLLHIAI